jgi:hypothetical protein
LSDVEQRKQLIRASAARLATKAFDRLNDEMDAGNIKGLLLMSVTGMATDKVVALSSSNTMQLQVIQTHHSSQELWDRLEELAARLKAPKACKVVESSCEQLPEDGQSPQKQTS